MTDRGSWRVSADAYLFIAYLFIAYHRPACHRLSPLVIAHPLSP
ncbi:hypothetical protein [Prevotella multiformis]|nr:hypothetical protein [Prevotella multiformis]